MRLKIQGKLTALLVSFAFVPLVAVLLVFLVQKENLEQTIVNSLNGYSRIIADTLNENLGSSKDFIEVISDFPLFKDNKNWGKDEKAEKTLNKIITNNKEYSLFLIIDTHGIVKAVNTLQANNQPLNTQNLYGQSMAQEKWFKNINALSEKKGSTIISEPQASPLIDKLYGTKDNYVITFTSEIHDEANQVIGYFVGIMDFLRVEEVIFPVIKGLVKQHMERAEYVLINPEGVLLSKLSFQDVETQSFKRDFNKLGITNLAQGDSPSAAEAVKGNSGFSLRPSKAYNGALAINTYAHFSSYQNENFHWSVVIRYPAEEAFAYISRILNTLIICIVTLLGILTALGLLIGKKFAMPVRQMTEKMLALTQGHTSIEIPYQKRYDEMGEMAQAVIVFRDNALKVKEIDVIKEQELQERQEKLKYLLMLTSNIKHEVNQTMDQVSKSAEEVLNVASSMTSLATAVIERGKTVEQLSKDASTNVSGMAAAIEELSSSISEIADQVSNAAHATGEAVDITSKTNTQVQNLSSAALRIGTVINLISEIAEQTNLLALNATIEAARAGDAGKGFAVVAAEVKNLANQTTKATEDITTQVSEIQTATASSVEAIQKITKSIEAISMISTSISSSVSQQSIATSEISRSTQTAAFSTSQVEELIHSLSEEFQKVGDFSENIKEKFNAVSHQIHEMQEHLLDSLHKIETTTVD